MEISQASSLESSRRVIERTHPREPEPVRIKLRLSEKKSNSVYPDTTMFPESLTATSLPVLVSPEPSMTILLEMASPFHQDDLPVLSASLGPLPAGSLDCPQKSQPAMPSVSAAPCSLLHHHPSPSQASSPLTHVTPNGSIVQRSKRFLCHGCMPLLPPARRQWIRDEMVTLTSEQVAISWPPRVSNRCPKIGSSWEFEFAAHSLRRSKNTDEDFDRPRLLDEFNFLFLPGSLDLSPQRANKHQLRVDSTYTRWSTAWQGVCQILSPTG